mgnify:CR=1 FL=1
MDLPSLSREKLTEFLTTGIPMPKTALTNENTIEFYFDELESFINSADNIYWARTTDYLELTITFDDVDWLLLRFVGKNILIFMTGQRADIFDTMTDTEASDIIGIVYGIVVYNEKWIEINEMIDEVISDSKQDEEYFTIKHSIDPKILDMLKKSPNNYRSGKFKVKNLKN